MRGCLSEIEFTQQQATAIGIDNQSAKIFAEEWMTQNRSKHIDTKYHYIRQQIVEKSIQLLYCPTKQMPADALTNNNSTSFEMPMGVRMMSGSRRCEPSSSSPRSSYQIGRVCWQSDKTKTDLPLLTL